ncbi:MAG: hypothetical protein JO117_01565, partial [Verrucomicrobia bacterium]|nr:hypothetical protein [Verrucomicrobiota bacterium]
MIHWFLTGGALLLLICFYGLGAALLLLPARWVKFWPAFCLPAGLGLQSALVWLGAHLTTLGAGTDHYAWATLLVPAVLLGGAWARLGGGRKLLALLARGARGGWPVGCLLIVSMGAQIVPFARQPLIQPRPFLTSISVGSCDAADYAAGGRVFKEFRRGDPSGFVGQSATAADASAGDFFEFWLHLNHFSPSALLALNGSLLGYPPWKLASLLGVVLLVCSLPVVHWLARAGFGFRPAGAWAVTLLYVCNPIELYAVYQTALAQLIAAPAIALLTWTGWRAYRAGARHDRWNAATLWQWSGLWLLSHWLLVGSYHFFLPFAYAPLLALVGMEILRSKSWRPALRWLLCLAVNLGLCALLFAERFSRLAERFSRFHATPFGWNIPALGPAGCFGLFADTGLAPVSTWLPLTLAFACLLTLLWTLVKPSRGSRQRALAAAWLLPAFAGYGLLLWLHGN